MPGEIFPDTGTLLAGQALQKFHERNRGATWLEAGVVEAGPEGNWVLEPDGRARFDDIRLPQVPYGPNPSEFVSVGTDLEVASTDTERAAIGLNGMPGMPAMDVLTGLDYTAIASMTPTRDEMLAAHTAKIEAQGYTIGD